MTRFGSPAVVGVALVLVGWAGAQQAVPKKPAGDAVENRLAVNMAMVEANELLLKGKPAEAVQVLEAQLSRIDGNREYLKLLRNSYQKYVINLYLNNQQDLAQKYLRRLRILDPEAADRLAVRPDSAVTKAPSEAAPLVRSPAPQVAPEVKPPVPPKEGATFRATDRHPDGEDPFSAANALQPEGGDARDRLASRLLAQADEKFRERRYEEARALYAQAYEVSKRVADAARDRWAYCRLNHVVDQLKHAKDNAAALPDLEREVQVVLAMSPLLAKEGQKILQQIAALRQAGAAARLIRVEHQAARSGGWDVAETTYFRVFHRGRKDYAEKAARVAEQTRADMSAKWFGTSARPWRRKCDIYLHETAADYHRETGVPPHSPGHSRIETDNSGGEIVSLRIDLHCDVFDLLEAVLPHETTHAVLAGQFGRCHVPRWVDEGIAVLSEPALKIDMHRRNLRKHAQEGELFAARELMELNDYPHPRRIGAFYAQSVALVEFLTQQKGPQVFTQFVREGLEGGYEAALRRHYGFRDFDDLQSRWDRAVHGDQTSAYPPQ